MVSNEKILNSNLQHLNDYVKQENHFLHELHSENKNLDEQLNTLKQENLKTEIDFFSHLHLYQTNFSYLINFIHFKDYKNQTMSILKSAFNEDAELLIADETIFI